MANLTPTVEPAERPLASVSYPGISSPAVPTSIEQDSPEAAAVQPRAIEQDSPKAAEVQPRAIEQDSPEAVAVMSEPDFLKTQDSTALVARYNAEKAAGRPVNDKDYEDAYANSMLNGDFFGRVGAEKKSLPYYVGKAIEGLPEMAEMMFAGTTQHASTLTGVYGNIASYVFPPVGPAAPVINFLREKFSGAGGEQNAAELAAGHKIAGLRNVAMLRNLSIQTYAALESAFSADDPSKVHEVLRQDFHDEVALAQALERASSGQSVIGEPTSDVPIDRPSAELASQSIAMDPLLLSSFLRGMRAAKLGIESAEKSATLVRAATAAERAAELAGPQASILNRTAARTLELAAKPVTATKAMFDSAGPVTRAGLAMGTAVATGMGPMAVLAAGLLGTTKALDVVDGALNSTLAALRTSGKWLRAPGPFSKTSAAIYESAAPAVKGYLLSAGWNLPFALGAENPEEAIGVISAGMIAHGVGQTKGLVNSLSPTSMMHREGARSPTQRTPVSGGEDHPLLNAAHHDVMTIANNAGNNLVQAARNFLHRNGIGGDLYLGRPSQLIPALHNMQRTGTRFVDPDTGGTIDMLATHDKQGNPYRKADGTPGTYADAALQHHGLAVGVVMPPTPESGGAPPVSRTIAIVPFHEGRPAVAVGHELWHVVETTVLSSEERAHYEAETIRVYGGKDSKEFNNARRYYSMLVGKDPANMSNSEVASELMGENFSGRINAMAVGAAGPGGEMTFKNPAYRRYVASVASLHERVLNTLGGKVPQTAHEVVKYDSEGNPYKTMEPAAKGAKATGLGFEASSELGHIIDNFIESKRLDSRVSETQGHPDPFTEKASTSAESGPITGAREVTPEPAFKKGDPIGDVSVDGKVYGTGTVIERVINDPDGNHQYEIIFTDPADGKRKIGTVAETALQSPVKEGAGAPEAPKKVDVGVLNPVPEALTVPNETGGPMPTRPVSPKAPVSPIRETAPQSEQAPVSPERAARVQRAKEVAQAVLDARRALEITQEFGGTPEQISAAKAKVFQAELAYEKYGDFGREGPNAASPNVRVTEQQQRELSDPGEAPPAMQATNTGILKANLGKAVSGTLRAAASDTVGPEADVRREQRLAADRAERSGFRNPLRTVYSKLFVPYRFLEGATPRVFGFSGDKLIQNISILHDWATRSGDTALASRLGSAGMTRLANLYLENQWNGYGGGGERLVRPADTKPGSVRPENPNFSPHQLSLADRQLMNVLMGFPVPGRSTPVTQWHAKMARENGISPILDENGVEITNPLYTDLVAKGLNPRILNSVVENLPVKNFVSELTPRPDINPAAGDVAITRAGFMPKADPGFPAKAEGEYYKVIPKGVNPLEEKGGNFFISPLGRWIRINGDHEWGAQEFLGKKAKEGGYPANTNEMVNRGFVRVSAYGSAADIHFTGEPNHAQLSALKDSAIEVGRALVHDDNSARGGKVIYEPEQGGKFMPRELSTPESLKESLREKDWAVLSATVKWRTAEENARATRELMAKLQTEGYDVTPVDGNYGGAAEKSFLVRGISSDEAHVLGNEFNQESVLVPEGLRYNDNSVHPHDGTIETSAEPFKENFTTLPGGLHFQYGLDFGKKIPPPKPLAKMDDTSYAVAPKGDKWAELPEATRDSLTNFRRTEEGRKALQEQAQKMFGKHMPAEKVEHIGLSKERIEELKNDPNVVWHGSASGDLRGGMNGLHVGTFLAAKQALEARIGHPAEGEWDGTREYGRTLLKGAAGLGPYEGSGFNMDVPEKNFYPQRLPTISTDSEGNPIKGTMDMKPAITPFRITGAMTNSPHAPHGDWRANGMMRGQIKKGNAKRGYYYTNEGEDAGSVSAVLPNGGHLDQVRYMPKAAPHIEKALKDSKVRDAAGNLLPVVHGTYNEFKRFKQGDLGFHFGTAEAANARIGHTISDTSPHFGEVTAEHAFDAFPEIRESLPPSGRGMLETLTEGARSIPVYLDIKNPLRMRDIGPWNNPEEVLFGLPREVLAKLPKSVGKAVDVYMEKTNDYSGPMGGYEEAQAKFAEPALTAIREGLKSLGYDGIVYKNDFEGVKRLDNADPGTGTHPDPNAPGSDSYIAFDHKQIVPAFAEKASARWMPKTKLQHDGEPLEHAVGGSLKLIHFGDQGMKEVDPAKFGKSGLTPSTELAGIPRSYFYEQGSHSKTDPVAGRGSVFGAKVSGNKIYDGNKDPLDWGSMPNREKADQMLLDQGYAGVRRTAGKVRQVEIFHPTKVTPIDGPNGKFMPKTDALGFYSNIEQSLEGWQPKGTPEQLLAHLAKTGGTKEEAGWIGLDDFLKGKKSVTKEEVAKFVADNKVNLEEVTHGGNQHDSEVAAWWNDEGGANEMTPFSELTSHERRRAIAQYRQEVTAFAEHGATKYENYTLPGGENYREHLLTMGAKPKLTPAETAEYKKMILQGDELPRDQWDRLNELVDRATEGTDEFKSSHWDEPNIVVHTRTTDRTTPGEHPDAAPNTLFLEEIQSDLHQKGREEGYVDPAAKPAAQKEYADAMDHLQERQKVLRAKETAYDLAEHPEEFRQAKEAMTVARGEYDAAQRRLEAAKTENSRLLSAGVPDFPFKTSWPKLALKRMIALAAQEGKDQIAWTTGEQQAERYDLSKQISRIELQSTHPDGSHGQPYLAAYDNEGRRVVDELVGTDGTDIERIIGKEAAKKLMDQPWKPYNAETARGTTITTNHKVLSGLDLKVGGEGMKGFYDKMLPEIANQIGKKYGAKVEQTTINGDNPPPFGGGPGSKPYPNGYDVHVLKLTPALREAALAGQPLFMPKAQGEHLAVPGEGKPIDVLKSRDYLDLAKGLTDDEARGIRRDTARSMVEIFKELPPDEEFMAAAQAGKVKRGWYARAAATLKTVFGADTERFVGLLSATSPRQSVLENLKMALSIWADWQDAGRPQDVKALTAIVEQHANLHARVPNSVRALQGMELVDDALSGYKVESFRKNLLGDMSAVTNDSWMAQFANIDQAQFGTKSGYLAYSAKVRKVAKKLGMTPAEVQETVWSFFKTLKEGTNVNRSSREALRSLSDSDILNTPEFHDQVLNDPAVRAQLERLGFTGFDQLADPADSARAVPRTGSLAEVALGEGGTRRLGALGRIADRAQAIHDAELATPARRGRAARLADVAPSPDPTWAPVPEVPGESPF